MREFSREKSFYLVLNLYTSFGYFENIDDDRRVLDHFRKSLRVGGHLVIDLLPREVLQRCFEPRHTREWEDGTVQLQERRVSADWTWIDVRWTLIRDGVERRFDLAHRIYGADELRAELQGAGFAEVSLFGGFDGRPCDDQAQRLVAVAAT